jgi:hypothetical protein
VTPERPWRQRVTPTEDQKRVDDGGCKPEDDIWTLQVGSLQHAPTLDSFIRIFSTPIWGISA